MIRLIWLVFGVIATQTACLTAHAASDDKGVDVTYVPKNFLTAVIIHPSRIDQSPVVADLPLNELWNLVQKQTNLDPRKLDRAILFIEPFPGGNVMFFPAVAIRFPEAADAQKLFAATLDKFETKELAKGQEYFNSTTQKMARVQISGFRADERTFLFAPAPTMIRMLTAKAPKSGLNDRLKTLDLDADITIVVVLEPIRTQLAALVKENPVQLPEKWLPATLRDDLESVTIKISLESPDFIHAIMEMKNVDSAKKVKQWLKDRFNELKPEFAELRKAAKASLPPKANDVVMAVIAEIENKLSIEQNEQNVIVRVPRPKLFAEAKKK